MPPRSHKRSLDPFDPRILQDRQRDWIDDAVVDEDWVRATRRFYPEQSSPVNFVRHMMQSKKVTDAVALARRNALRMAHVEKAWVVRRLVTFCTADINDLVEGRRVACRYCYGMDHRYQFRAEELRQERQQHILKQMKLPPDQRVEFDDHGGEGYTTRRDPHPDCPQCDGDGILNVVFKDTRRLSPGAALLYDGFETKADGSVRMKIRDRMWAEQALLRHAGVATERKEILVRRLDIDSLTDEELRAAIMEAEAKATIELEGSEFVEVEPDG